MAVADLVPGRVDRAWIGLGGDHAENAGDHVRGGELLLACQPVDPLRHALSWARQWRLRCPAGGRAGGLVSTVVNGPLATGKHVSLIVIGVPPRTRASCGAEIANCGAVVCAPVRGVVTFGLGPT